MRPALLGLVLLSASPLSAQQWSGGGLDVSVVAGRITVSAAGDTLIRNARIRFGLLDALDVQVERRGADSLVLAYTFASPATAHSGQAVSVTGPAAERPLTVSVAITPVTGGIRLHGEARWARHLAVGFDDLGDHAFGLIEWLYPDNDPAPDLRGHVVPVEIEGAGSRWMENYASAASAFFLSSRGYGSFFDTFARGRYTFGVAGRHELYHETGTLDWYLFHGPDGVAIHRSYYAVIGAPKHVPLWALGPVAWRDENRGGKDEVLDDAARLTELRIPITAMWIDRPYSNGTNGWSAMDFNAQFADPGTWIRTLRERFGLELMTWAAPLLFSPADSFPGSFGDPVGYFDLSNAAARAEFERRLSTAQYRYGVRGHKLDRADQNLPTYERWADSTPVEAQRNRYLYLFARSAHDMLTRAWGEDQFNFARGAYHRTQPYLSALWGGDPRSTWSGMALNLANGIRTQFMGFPIWGSDVGGYLGSGRIDEELYARWLQLGLWSGLFEIKLDGSGGSGEDRPPWRYSPRLQAIFRAAAEQRMRMLPTIYSLANSSARHGVLMQPLAYAFPSDTATYRIWDQWLFGGRFLVAPLLQPGGSRSVYLPAGRWVELGNPARSHEGPRTIQVTAELEQIPVYVRAGSVYVTGDVFAGNQRAWRAGFERERRLAIRAYPDALAPGHTFEYLDPFDGDRARPIILLANTRGLTLTAPPLGLPGDAEIVLPRAPASVSAGGRAVRVRYDAGTQVLRVPFAADRPVAIEVRY